MKNVKFWLAQIAMVAIVSMIFGSPAFTGPSGDPSNEARQGFQTDNSHNGNGMTNSNSAATGFGEEATGGEENNEEEVVDYSNCGQIDWTTGEAFPCPEE